MSGKTEYKNQWTREHSDRFTLILAKGRKAEIKAAADARGQSLNSFINEAIDEHMEQLGHKNRASE